MAPPDASVDDAGVDVAVDAGFDAATDPTCFDGPVFIADDGDFHPSRAVTWPVGVVSGDDGWFVIHSDTFGSHVTELSPEGEVVRQVELGSSFGAFMSFHNDTFFVGDQVVVRWGRLQRAGSPTDGFAESYAWWNGSALDAFVGSDDRLRVIGATWDSVTAGLDIAELELGSTPDQPFVELSREPLPIETSVPVCAFDDDGEAVECVTVEGDMRRMRFVRDRGSWSLATDVSRGEAPFFPYAILSGSRVLTLRNDAAEATYVESLPGEPRAPTTPHRGSRGGVARDRRLPRRRHRDDASGLRPGHAHPPARPAFRVDRTPHSHGPSRRRAALPL